MREKTSRFTTVPDFPSVGVVFKADIAKQGGEKELPAAGLLIQALGHPSCCRHAQRASPDVPARTAARTGGSPGRPVSPRARGGRCGPRAPRALRGCPAGEPSPNRTRGHPGGSRALHRPGGGSTFCGVFFVWLFGCSELKAAPARLAGAGEALGRACAGCSGPRSALRTHRRPTHTHTQRALRILPPKHTAHRSPSPFPFPLPSRSHSRPVPAPVPNPAPFPLRVSPRGASSSPGARPARPAAEPRPWRSRAGALRAPAGTCNGRRHTASREK